MEIMEMKKKDLPNATAVLVLGILSLVFCWCYGFVGLVLGTAFRYIMYRYVVFQPVPEKELATTAP